MSNTYEKILNVISKPPAFRQDFEIQTLMPWLRKQSQLFSQLKTEYLKDILRNCGQVTFNKDDIIIKQGDQGDCFYMILGGKISIYILNKEKNEEGDETVPLDQIGTRNAKGQLDRSKLGIFVTHLGTGVPFGDVALMSEDCVRTATIIAEEETDLLVVDRALYNRAVKEVLAKEYEDKVSFINNNPLFSAWPPRYKKQLTMAMFKEEFTYNTTLVKQGDPVDIIYFLIRGHVELRTDPAMHPVQYPKIYLDTMNEGERLIKRDKVRPPTESHYNISTHLRKKDHHKHVKMFLLGKNESVGELEVLLGMDTYMQTAVCTEKVEVLVLEMKHYERLFVKRHPRTIDDMRRILEVKLETRMKLLSNKTEIPFLSRVKTKLNMINNPQPVVKKEKDLPSQKMAEKEFLNHKGPLIDMYGPGSVFYMIRVREKTKVKGFGSREKRKPKHINKDSNENEHLHAIKVPQTLVLAAQMAGATKDREVLERETTTSIQAPSSKGNPLGAKSFRRIQSAIKPDEEPMNTNLDSFEFDDDKETSRSWPHETRYGTTVSFMDAEDDVSLSRLENKVRNWLSHGNPKSGPQVTQLRRLAVEDLENTPKPGNRVVVHKRSRSTHSSSSGNEVESTASKKESPRQEEKFDKYRILLAH
ncbi:uncharacterized protein LOC133192625 [Saccostrea echinata]|uniref:uncharacterized protein LOC133192625 n=1 Tax=Saccostrea echinata TaxID=191078 RepID=UPI002A81916C|nr:uncharacterized protein LOC133192625 [Saccostrea echinata]